MKSVLLPGAVTRAFLAVILAFFVVGVDAGPAEAQKFEKASRASRTLDHAEKLHLRFMREEEKLARDVYITLGAAYPAVDLWSH